MRSFHLSTNCSHFVKEMVEGLDLSEVEWKMDLYKVWSTIQVISVASTSVLIWENYFCKLLQNYQR